MMIKAAYGYHEALFSSSSLKTILDFYTGVYKCQSNNFRQNTFVLTVGNEKVGFAEVDFEDSVKKMPDVKDFVKTFGIKDICKLLLLKRVIFFSIPRSEAYLHYLAVEEKYKGQGYGTTLLKKVEKEAVSRQCNKIFLLTYPSNTRAIKFYERHGYRAVGKPRTGYGLLPLLTNTPAVIRYEKQLSLQ
ncbi:uncharacterized protein LOC133196263 isoform X2 [Saccostrea echinata]|uniref:uncharacterized protein LOC133196263 isoform X2 n=1 Tax=Saccostrea echinata TaxID=191078 RepID=UPI002A80741E|nr:uncharacterized protein LOC133196263 isoform X2 [Saccostrea echinata]